MNEFRLRSLSKYGIAGNLSEKKRCTIARAPKRFSPIEELVVVPRAARAVSHGARPRAALGFAGEAAALSRLALWDSRSSGLDWPGPRIFQAIGTRGDLQRPLLVEPDYGLPQPRPGSFRARFARGRVATCRPPASSLPTCR